MINFLKELPDRYLILLCFFVLLALYIEIRSDAVLQLMINFGVAIIALSTKTTKAAIQADNIETAKTESGDIITTPGSKI